MKKKIVAGGGIAVVLIGAGAAYWQMVGQYRESTDNAYLQADIATVSPRLPGYIEDVFVSDNEMVEQGQIVAQIQLPVYAARADLAAADVAHAQATLAQAVLDLRRAKSLLASTAGTRQRYDEAVAEEKSARAGLKAAQARHELAKIDVYSTDIRAPLAGVIGARTVQPGQYVKPGNRLMAVVPLQDVYVLANFKETQLEHIVPGQSAKISVDSFDGEEISGVVDSLAPASGAEFSLLPPDNATGNFTKIVQRIPVKILIDSDTLLVGRLRPGMSVEVTVNTKSRKQGGKAVVTSGR